jgi:hypothetical protein
VLKAAAIAMASLAPFSSSVEPLSKSERTQLKARGFWHKGCPVPLSGLRVIDVSYVDWQGEAQRGQVVVNRRAARPLVRVFRKLYRQRFPIRHMKFADVYGPRSQRKDDVSGSFECRRAVPSPCSPGRATGWSMHAYGLAIDLNPRENPYVGCGMSRDPKARRYRDRSRHRKGMVTRGVVRAFASIGWRWGGAWTGNTKDYMHFSSTGH